MDRRSGQMAGQSAEQAARTLRDYPISLRHSARAVFGSDYDDAEKQEDGLRDPEGKASAIPLARS